MAKMTVNFNSSTQNDTSTILSSGPLKIFAILDTVSDLYTTDLVDAILNSTEYNKTPKENIVVYIKNTAKEGVDNQEYLGSYYLFKNFIEKEQANGNTNFYYPVWNEVLLGSHVHDNKPVLDNLSNLDYSGLTDEKVLKVKTDGTFSLDDVPEVLPDFPSDIQERILLYKNAVAAGKNTSSLGVPNVYLTNDNNGKLIWENKIIPAQSFYFKTISKEIDKNSETTTLTFTGVKYNSKTDIAIVFINETIAFDSEVNVAGTAGDDIGITINNKWANGDPNVPEHISLLCIKNTASENITRELAENYITKEEAITLLSRGKIDLSSYATKLELNKKADIGHSHSQYALKGHTHDFRYAAYYHTHPELAALIAKLATGATSDEVNSWMTSLENLIKDSVTLEAFKALLKDAGFVSSEDSSGNITYSLTTDTVNFVTSVSDLSAYNGKSMTEILENIFTILKDDTVNDDKVLLSDDLPVILNGQTIGGLTQDKVYTKGTDLRQILIDIFNPHISISKLQEILTPASAEIEWYTKDLSLAGAYSKININSIPADQTKTSIPLYFKVGQAYNKNGEKCTITLKNLDIETITYNTQAVPNGYIVNSDGYYTYGTVDFSVIKNFSFYIQLMYETFQVKDNYNITGLIGSGVLGTMNYFNSVKQTLNISAPLYFIGSVNTLEPTNMQVYSYYNDISKIKTSFDTSKKYFELIYQKSYEPARIIQTKTGHNIKDAMDYISVETNIMGTGANTYGMLYYEAKKNVGLIDVIVYQEAAND